MTKFPFFTHTVPPTAFGSKPASVKLTKKELRQQQWERNFSTKIICVCLTLSHCYRQSFIVNDCPPIHGHSIADMEDGIVIAIVLLLLALLAAHSTFFGITTENGIAFWIIEHNTNTPNNNPFLFYPSFCCGLRVY